MEIRGKVRDICPSCKNHKSVTSQCDAKKDLRIIEVECEDPHDGMVKTLDADSDICCSLFEPKPDRSCGKCERFDGTYCHGPNGTITISYKALFGEPVNCSSYSEKKEKEPLNLNMSREQLEEKILDLFYEKNRLNNIIIKLEKEKVAHMKGIECLKKSQEKLVVRIDVLEKEKEELTHRYNMIAKKLNDIHDILKEESDK